VCVSDVCGMHVTLLGSGKERVGGVFRRAWEVSTMGGAQEGIMHSTGGQRTVVWHGAASTVT
jgi:hypothetical protein